VEPTTREDFSTLADYQRWVEAGGNRQNKFTFKVGVFDKHRFSFDQLGHFFHAFVPDPPAYLSCRMAMFLFRDVQGWDDGRLTKAFQPAPSK